MVNNYYENKSESKSKLPEGAEGIIVINWILILIFSWLGSVFVSRDIKLFLFLLFLDIIFIILSMKVRKGSVEAYQINKLLLGPVLLVMVVVFTVFMAVLSSIRF